MGFIDDELSELRKLCERRIAGSKLVSCVPAMVRIEIARTRHKRIVVCVQFPEEYPKVPLLLELKSKTLSEKLLLGLTTVCEQEARKYLRKAQVLPVLAFIRNFIDENPLSCCYDEINSIKKLLNGAEDELKLKQKTSSVHLKIVNDKYYFNTRISVPEDYPETSIKLEKIETNFPDAFFKHMVSQAHEIARRCVEAPLKPKKNEPTFKPGPSLYKTVVFLVDCVKRLPSEKCQICKEQCFPSDPTSVVRDEQSPRHVERVLCGHLFHLQCFLEFMRKPPFGNKKCGTCGGRIFHHKWSLNDRLAEDRWAHEQARERELAEVEDFFK